jgi:hypothetical protein
MRSISILADIEEVLRQLVIAIPEVYLDYDVRLIELAVDDEDRPTCWEIVFVESEETELVIGEVVLLENFEAVIMIFED